MNTNSLRYTTCFGPMLLGSAAVRRRTSLLNAVLDRYSSARQMNPLQVGAKRPASRRALG
jgi:hypothetical protein